MNHLDAISLGIKANVPYNEIVRKVFLTYPTKAFIGFEDQQYLIFNKISIFFDVQITCVQVTGSAKIGRSLHKNIEFRIGESDLDVAIIDASLFVIYMDIALRISKGYSDGSVFPFKNGISTKEEYIRNIAKGIFRPDLMPVGEERARWRDFFGNLSGSHTQFFRSISAAIYISQACFEAKQRSAITNYHNNFPI